ncbi:MAG: YceI family protein [Gemmatimonadaceae bacterium]
MIRTELLALTAILAVAMPTRVVAQGTAMTVNPASKVTLSGGSNVHDWSCKSSAFQATIEVDSAYETRPMTELAKPIRKVSVTIPVKSLKCGKGKMDENMYKALREPEFPEIRYVLESYEVDTALTTRDAFTARTVGTLTVAGAAKQVEIPITAQRQAGGTMKGEGALKFLMTDFGIKPPVALLGTLRTKNEAEVNFEVLLDRAVIVALTQTP